MKKKGLYSFSVLMLFLMPVSAFPCEEWTSQNPLPQGNDLTAVWGSSPNDVFAVGNNGTILHCE